jgi:hypothetical protein
LFDGVKIIVLPCQWNEPGTAGVIENALCAVPGFTSSLKVTLMEARTSARPLPEDALLRLMA